MRLVPLAVLLLVFPILAQRYDDTITVNVVDVPVYVERFGKPITGLAREDFELFVDGKPHPIDYFDVIDETAPAEDVAKVASAPVDLQRRRLIVLLFDVSAPPHELQRARKAAAKYVENGGAGDTFAVATVSWPGVLFIVPFTNDRVNVQRAIATLRPSEARDPFRVATLAVERSWADVGGADAGRGVIGDVFDGGHPEGFEPPAVAGRFVDAAVDFRADQNDFGSRGLIDNLIELADRLAALDGLKEVVLLSEGYSDPTAAYTWAGQLASIVRLHKRFRAAGVVLNAVDIRTPAAPGESASSWVSMSSAPDLMTSEFLWSLALDTGGIATSSMPELQKRHSVGYLLGFRAPAGKRSSSIHVNVKNVPFLTDVRYRKSYTLGQETKDEGLFLADTLLNDIPQKGVTLDLNVDGTWVAASIPGAELLSYASESRVKLDVYLYVFDEQNRAVAWNRMQIVVDLEKGREFLRANPYTMRQEFVLDPGRYIAKVLVRIEDTDRVGFERTEFEVMQ